MLAASSIGHFFARHSEEKICTIFCVQVAKKTLRQRKPNKSHIFAFDAIKYHRIRPFKNFVSARIRSLRVSFSGDGQAWECSGPHMTSLTRASSSLLQTELRCALVPHKLVTDFRSLQKNLSYTFVKYNTQFFWFLKLWVIA